MLLRLFTDKLSVHVRRAISSQSKLFGSAIENVPNSNHVRIPSFPVDWFNHKLRKAYGTSRLSKLYTPVGWKLFGRSDIVIHKFFLPEFVYLLDTVGGGSGRVQDIIDSIAFSTWVKDLYSDAPVQTDTDMSRIEKNMNVELFDWQREFIEQYDLKRRRAHLNGELLSFGCGLGKTITALATMESVGCDCVIVLAPKSTLSDVWVDHIQKFYKTKKKFYLVNVDEPHDADFFIFNYESMDKVEGVMKYISEKKKLGIVVDESHNFLKMKSERTQNLIKLRDDTGCEHVLLQSGTPVKAVGTELMPLLRVLDGFFDEEAESIFKDAFGLNTNIATDVLHARLNLMMVRKKMEDVYKLPEKTSRELAIEIPEGDEYTVTKVKNTLIAYTKERLEYHTKRMPEYKRMWDLCIKIWDVDKELSKTTEYNRWKKIVTKLIKSGYDPHNKELRADIAWANIYEKDTLIPALPSKKFRDGFKECKSKVKYLDLCIQGEVLGHLEKLRALMTSAMLAKLDIDGIVSNSLKKVIFFTTYVDTVQMVHARCKELGIKDVLVYGETSKHVNDILDKFRKDRSVRVLVATIQTLATGVTLTEANTVVFCNMPYRSADREQAENRVWRIGQDTECEIIQLRLDTGKTPNLSDRTQEIHDWSKSMTDAIVDGTLNASRVGVEKLMISDQVFDTDGEYLTDYTGNKVSVFDVAFSF